MLQMSGSQKLGASHATLTNLLGKREKLAEELKIAEKQVYDLETAYLLESTQFGSVLKGFESFLSSSKSAGNLKRSRKFQPEDRLFSLSSVTSPAVEEHAAGRDLDGRMDGVQARSKGTALANGPGKQKRGRTGPREGKRVKQANEQEVEEEEDATESLSRQVVS